MCLLLKWTTKSLVVLMMIFELKISSSQCWLSDWFEWFTIGAASEGQIIRASGALACRESFIGQMVFLSWLITAASPHSQTVFITHLTPSASCLLPNKDSIQRLSKMLKAFSHTFFPLLWYPYFIQQQNPKMKQTCNLIWIVETSRIRK